MAFTNLTSPFRKPRKKDKSSTAPNDSESHSGGTSPSAERAQSASAACPDAQSSDGASRPLGTVPSSASIQHDIVNAYQQQDPDIDEQGAVKPRVMDGALSTLAPLSGQLDPSSSISKNEQALDTMGDKLDVLLDQTGKAMSVFNDIASAASAIEKTELARDIERGIRRFVDDIPWLMRSLDELARIHPAVTVAVLAFKAVYSLEKARQENDRRILTLYVEMKEMMMVMVQLRGVENRTHIGLDGRTLKDRLEQLAETTAEDIKACANFCDAFLKKHLLVKVLKGPVWAEKLAAFVRTFSDRKADFQFALAMHTANSLTDVKRQNYDIDAKIETVITLFNRFLSVEEQYIVDEVEDKGGAAKVRQNDEDLRSLIAVQLAMRQGFNELGTFHGAPRPNKPANRSRGVALHDGRKNERYSEAPIALEDLKRDLREDVDEALARNLQTFLGKFELQVSMLQVALERYIREENDRIIGAVTEVVTQGPHLKVKDLELRKLWHDMNWRGNVKGRLLLMTLRDHYREVIEDARHGTDDENIINDEWALEYINPSCFQPLLAAFDDDASGYVTIAELNKFMEQRPSSWSVPRWLAYWAVGWGASAASYCNKIKETLAQIKDRLPYVLALNRKAVDDYLRATWEPTMRLVSAVRSEYVYGFYSRFQYYDEAEEQRIISSLERLRYYIDASETIALVLGPHRPEKSILRLLYLLLENDRRKVYAAERYVLADTEFPYSCTTMNQVFTAVRARYNDLKSLFREQKLDLNSQFDSYSAGMFYYFHYDEQFWHPDRMKDNTFILECYNYRAQPDTFGFAENTDIMSGSDVYNTIDGETEEDLTAPTPVSAIIGFWSGFAYTSTTGYPTSAMLSFRFHYEPSPEDVNGDGGCFRASGIQVDGEAYNVSGRSYTDEKDGAIIQVVEWKMQHSGDSIFCYKGRLEDEYTIVGTRGYDDWYDSADFILKRTHPDNMCLRPSPSALVEGKARQLWLYAISAVLHDVRKRNWTWSFFAARRDARERYIRTMARKYGRPDPDFDYATERMRAHLGCNPQDARFYHTLVERYARIVPEHGICCGESCRAYIGGACVICLDCMPESDRLQPRLTFCDDPRCYGPRIEWVHPAGAAHEPSHDLLKVRTVLHDAAVPDMLVRAQRGLLWVREETDVVLPDPPPAAEPAGPASGVNGDTGDGNPLEHEDEDVDGARAVDEADAVVPAPRSCKCKVCLEPVFMGQCWYCLDCLDYVCDDCDARRLIFCHWCRKPFEQRTLDWYAGMDNRDFICTPCSARGIVKQTDWALVPWRSHALSHSLVRCKRKPDGGAADGADADADAGKPGTEERLASLEARMAGVDEKLERLQGHVLRLEEVIVGKLDEALSRFAGMRSFDGHGGNLDVGPSAQSGHN
ncbi:hypothetical protein FKP32DRAFT_1586395 [Trametes sanguinea]|nr:hypothetical protein FKP32DRAFT_1586395 [Trametes sanguinea]